MKLLSDHHHILKTSLETEFIKRSKRKTFYRCYKSADILELHSNIDKNTYIAIVVSIKLVRLCPIKMRPQTKFSGLLIIYL